MNIFIDCEFNEFKGELISMALVAANGQEFYEVLDCPEPKDWVKVNVMPILNKGPVPLDVFHMKLQRFLCQFDNIHIIADWPEDVKHFCDTLIIGPGSSLNTPPLMFSIYQNIYYQSALPHNALEDARAIAKYFKEINYNES